MNHFKILSRKRVIQLFLFFSYIACWFSISTSLQDVFLVTTGFSDVWAGTSYKGLIINFINFFRHGFVYICLFF